MKDGQRETIIEWIHAVRAGVFYFAMVFAAGFVLGFVRVLFLIPSIGVRAAELIEMPLMIAISYFAARWLIGRFRITYKVSVRLAVGAIALFLLIAAELSVVVFLQKMTLSEYIASRDPISGTAYLISVLLFGLFPLVVRRSI